jgi:hypothetical protein
MILLALLSAHGLCAHISTTHCAVPSVILRWKPGKKWLQRHLLQVQHGVRTMYDKEELRQRGRGGKRGAQSVTVAGLLQSVIRSCERISALRKQKCGVSHGWAAF